MTFNEDGTRTFDPSIFLANDGDVDNPNSDLHIVGVSDSTGGQAFLNPDGSITFVPDADYFGEAGFSYRLSDGEAVSDPVQVTMSITAVNDAPEVTTGVPFYQMSASDTLALHGTGISISDVETDPATGVLTTVIEVTGGRLLVDAAGYSDVTIQDNDTPQVTLTGSADDLNAILSGLGGSAVTYYNDGLDAAQNAEVEITVSDGELSTTKTVPISISRVDSGGLGDDRSVLVTEDEAFVFSAADFAGATPIRTLRIESLPGKGKLLLNGEEVGTTPFDITIAQLDAGALTFEQENPNENGSAYTSLKYNFEAEQQDEDGNLDYIWSSRLINLFVGIDPVNDLPTSGDAVLGVSSGTTHIFSAADFPFFDVDTATDGQSLGGVRIEELVGGGTLRFNGAVVTTPIDVAVAELGDLTYARSDNTSANIVFRVGDSHDPTGFSEETYRLLVNDRPRSENWSLEVYEDTATQILAGNFTFVDDNEGDFLTMVRIDALPAEGELRLAGRPVVAGQEIEVADLVAGLLVYVPPAGVTGADYASVAFSVKDSAGLYSAASYTFDIDIKSVNDKPEIVGDLEASVLDAGVYTLTLRDLDARDPDDAPEDITFSVIGTVDGDVQKDGLTVSSFTVAELRAGRITFAHDSDAGSFTFLLEDGNEDN